MDLQEQQKQQALDLRYLRMARIWAENSYCVRRQVGALIVKDKMIISDGYNGTPSGFENVCEDDNGLTKPYVLHAEANAITKIARSGNNSDGATLYVTASPCIECAKLIIQAGIRRVVPIVWPTASSCSGVQVSKPYSLTSKPNVRPERQTVKEESSIAI